MGVEINMAAHAVSGIASPPQPCHQLCRPAAACPSASNVECNVPTDALRLDRAPGPRAWAARMHSFHCWRLPERHLTTRIPLQKVCRVDGGAERARLGDPLAHEKALGGQPW